MIPAWPLDWILPAFHLRPVDRSMVTVTSTEDLAVFPEVGKMTQFFCDIPGNRSPGKESGRFADEIPQSQTDR